MSDLTPKQAAFVREYLIDFNGAQASIRAGYAAKGANGTGARLLANPSIQIAIKKATEKTGEKKADLRERVIEELILLGFSSLNDYLTIDRFGVQMKETKDIPPEKMRCVESIKVTEHRDKDGEGMTVKTEYKLHPKTKALELLARHLGMLNDKLQIEPPEPVIITRRNGETIELGVKKR